MSMARPRRPRDSNQIAKLMVDLSTGEAEEPAPDEPSGKRRGGKAGGRARAAALTAEQRQAIARKAAAARWGKQSRD